MRARAAFSLMEIIVSLMIFSVISIAMVGVFATATNLFRAGESARTASDEAVTVLSMIDEDLRRAVAPQEGGFLLVRTSPGSGNAAGNMVLAIKIHNPDRSSSGSGVAEKGLHGRLIVVYWVDDQGNLNRQQAPAADSLGALGSAKKSEYDVAARIFGTPNVVATGCIYFGIDLSTALVPRGDCGWNGCLPTMAPAYRYCTEDPALSSPPAPATPNPGPIEPFPEALRISIAITGGNRHAPVGTFVTDTGSGFRVSGVKGIPIGSGSMARIGDPGPGKGEWIGYDRFAGGVLTLNGATPQRGMRRTAPLGHAAGEPVYFTPTYTLIRSFAR